MKQSRRGVPCGSRFQIGQVLMNRYGELEGAVTDITYAYLKTYDNTISKLSVVHLDYAKEGVVKPVAVREDYLTDYVGIDPDGEVGSD